MVVAVKRRKPVTGGDTDILRIAPQHGGAGSHASGPTRGSLLHSQGSQHGLSLSLPSLLQALHGIQEVTNVYPATGPTGRGRPRVQTTLTEMDAMQQTLYRLFNLDRYRQARF